MPYVGPFAENSMGLTDLLLSDSMQDLELADADQAYLSKQLVQRKLKSRCSDIVWFGIAWSSKEQLKHYSAFCKNAILIPVHSFVHVLAEDEINYLGYIEDMYEGKKGEKKVQVRWFHHSQEVKSVFPKLNLHPREIIMTPHVQVITAECVDGPATVLTPKHYEKCLATGPYSSFSGLHICLRQFKDNKLMPFTISKMQGYWNQTMLSCLDGPTAYRTECHKLLSEDEECFIDFLRSFGMRNSNYSALGNGASCRLGSTPMDQGTVYKSMDPMLQLRLSSKTMGMEFLEPELQTDLPFKAGDKIELLSQDSGIRGCWFRCKILTMSEKKLKIQYEDVEDVEDLCNLEEWVPACRVAAPDKLGMRCPGRQTVRPFPPEDSTNCFVEIGTPVDAWWSDGWWEGVVSGINVSGKDTLEVYCPDEDRFLTVEKKDVRTSRDWDGDKWVEVMVNPDILTRMLSIVSSSADLSVSAAVGGTISCVSAAVDDGVLQVEANEDDQAESLEVHLSDKLESINVVRFRN